LKRVKYKSTLPEIEQYDYRRSRGNEHIFSSISELLSFIDFYDTSECYFRGQTGLWDVTSSLHRHYGKPEYNKAINICVSVVNWLKQNEYISGVVKNDDNQALAIAQHYGCPTDMVDITSDLMTAAYFATSDEANGNGCIWIFSPDDFEIMEIVMRYPPRGMFSGLSQDIIDKLAASNYSQLIRVNIPELSRLNAQKGLFLWDFCGVLQSQIIKNHIGIRLVFKHSKGERDLFTDKEKQLFPFPNQLETEIMRVLSETNRENGIPTYSGIVKFSGIEHEGKTHDGIPSLIADKAASTFNFPYPDYFVPSFCGYKWLHRGISEKTYNTCKINKEECTDCFLPLNISNIINLVQTILDGIKNDTLCDYLVIFFDNGKSFAFENEKFFIDTIVALNNYMYDINEISRVVFEMVKIVIFAQKIKWQNDAIGELLDGSYNSVGNLLSDYYNTNVTKISINDSAIPSRFFLPDNYEFLDNNCKVEFDEFLKTKRHLTQPTVFYDYFDSVFDNAMIFRYQSHPQKIISYENLKKMFIDLILPQQFLFRELGLRSYIPDYVKIMTLPIYGRNLYMGPQ